MFFFSATEASRMSTQVLNMDANKYKGTLIENLFQSVAVILSWCKKKQLGNGSELLIYSHKSKCFYKKVLRKLLKNLRLLLVPKIVKSSSTTRKIKILDISF